MAGPVNLIPPALACGFGELGKHGSIINRRYGASFRLASVLTEMPLIEDQQDVECRRHLPELPRFANVTAPLERSPM